MDEESRLEEVLVEDVADTQDAVEAHDAVGAEGGPDEPGPKPARRRRSILRRLLNWAGWTVVATVVLIVLFFSQTSRGQQVVLEEVLSRARGYLAGELTVEGMRSSTLFFGLTLQDVRLDAEGGRRFLEADSVVLRYSPLSLAIGSPRLRSSTLHGLNLEISRYPGDDFSNVDRIVAASSSDDSTSAPRTLGLGRIAVRGGTVEILTPAVDAPEELTVAAPDGGRLRRMSLEGVDLDLEQTFFRSDGPVMVDASLASLSTSVFVLERPLVIHEARGDVTFGDRGLRIDDAAFRLPGSYLEGRLGFGPEGQDDPWLLRAEFSADDWGDLADIAWVDPRFPAGSFRGAASVRLEDGIQISLTGVDVRSGGSSLALDGDVAFADAMSMRALLVVANPLQLSLVRPWLQQELPFAGDVRGSATLGGTMAALSATGRMTFSPAERPEAVTTADFSGTLHSGANPGGTALDLRLDPFDYRVLEPLWPNAADLGTGRATLFLEGRADDGMLLVADVTHRSSPTVTSRAVGRGVARRDAGREWTVDARAELTPLSLPMLGRLWPEIDLPGEVRGPVRINGRLTDLQVTGDVTSDQAGRFVFDLTADMTDPASGYVVDADAEDLDLAAFTSRVPAPSVLSGHATIEGSGFLLDSVAASAVVALRSARFGDLTVDSAGGGLRIDRGLLTADSLRASIGGILVDGDGSLGLTDGTYGQARLSFTGETLLGLRPVFMGDSLLVADTLTILEQDALEARGVSLDTLPTLEDVRMEGRLSGSAELSGSVGDLNVDLLFDLIDAAYGHNSVDTARVSLIASGLPETLGEWDVGLAAGGVVWGEREFEEVRFDGSMVQRAGEGQLEILRRPGESYYLAGAFAVDSVGGQVQLNDASLEFSQMSWVLMRPTSLAWNEASISVDSLEIRRVDTDPMTLTAAGTLTRGGDSDFQLSMEGLHVEQVLRLAQREDIDMVGHVDLDLDITGPAEEPRINARLAIEEPRYGPVQLTRLDGALEYRGRSADVEFSLWSGERQVLTGDGVVPVDLALADVESRLVEEEMDLTLRADSLDAGLAFVYLSALEDVVGTISAEMRVRGTPVSPRPSGTVTLANAAWTLDAIGVRHLGVSGELLLQPNGTVGVKLASAGTGNGAFGTSTISGLVQLDTLQNPRLDLAINFDRFLTVDRRDMQGRVSGDLTLTGRYRLPVARGELTLDEATLFVEEFSRNADVVDLRSPLLYAPGIAVDTTVFVSQPLIAGLNNPFLDNLRMDVDLVVPRNLWLRSPEMNVELGGELIVLYDRGEGDLVLVGELEALRGSYAVFGRTFEVDGGTTAFLGQPGINPTLDIQALTRVRRQEGGPLEVRATVGGTLVEPLVTLSTEEAGLSQADLVSYLIFGQSIGEAGALGANLQEAGLSYLGGTLFNQLGSALAQEIPLVNSFDYLSFSQASRGQDYQSFSSNPGNVLGGTQVELGKYLNDQVFVVFVLGGSQDQETGASLQLRGVRLEFALAQNLFLEGFMEDRFLRSGANFGSTDLANEQVIGVFLFSEWGYGSSQRD